MPGFVSNSETAAQLDKLNGNFTVKQVKLHNVIRVVGMEFVGNGWLWLLHPFLGKVHWKLRYAICRYLESRRPHVKT